METESLFGSASVSIKCFGLIGVLTKTSTKSKHATIKTKNVNRCGLLLLSSLHQACPGSKISLCQPHLLPRGTHLHRLPLTVLLPSPQNHATLGSPVPLPCPLLCHLLLVHCQTPTYPLRRGVLKTTTWQPTGLELNTSSNLESPAHTT